VFAVNPTTEANYLIITHPSLVGSSSWLNDLEQLQADRGYFVGSYQVIDGTTTNSELQTYIANAYNSGVQLEYVLLVGSASMESSESSDLGWGKFIVDPRNFDRDVVGAQDYNFIPFLFETRFCWNEERDIPTDDIYDPDFSNLSGLTIGRLPAHSSLELENYVDKLAAYYNGVTSFADWKGEEILLSQNADNPWTYISGSNVDQMYSILSQYIPATVGLNELRANDIDPNDPWYADGTKSDSMEDAFVAAINAGAGIIHYFGTGAEAVSLGNFFWQKDVSIGGGNVGSDYLELVNAGMYPLVLANSCNLGEVQYPFSMLRRNLLRDMLFLDGAGIISAIAPTIDVATKKWTPQ